jgi:hypothetical protein
VFPLGAGYTLVSASSSTPIVVFAHQYTPDADAVKRELTPDAEPRAVNRHPMLTTRTRGKRTILFER